MQLNQARGEPLRGARTFSDYKMSLGGLQKGDSLPGWGDHITYKGEGQDDNQSLR